MIVTFGVVVEKRKGPVTEVFQNMLKGIRIGIDEVGPIHQQITFPRTGNECGEEAAFG